MPYIKQEDRERLKIEVPQTPGELNFLLTMACRNFLNVKFAENKKLSYSDFNDVVGALEACKLEFYRRLVVQYENVKIEENGDVW